MPPRLVCVAILLLWAVAAVALFTRDLLPDLLIGPPPDLRAVVQAEDTARPTKWAILVADDAEATNTRSVGQATTRASRRRDGDFVLSSEAWIDSAEVLRGTRFASDQGERIDVGGEYVVDPSGNLDHFRAWVQRRGEGHDQLILTGRLTKRDELEVNVTGTFGAMPLINSNSKFPYQRRSLVQSALGPLDRMPGLQLGQIWETRVVSPLTGQVVTGRVEVARRVTITWDNNPTKTFEVVTRMGFATARTWVRPADGLVLRQEVPFPLVKLVLERVPDDNPAAGRR
jgi:hypothetical protein